MGGRGQIRRVAPDPDAEYGSARSVFLYKGMERFNPRRRTLKHERSETERNGCTAVTKIGCNCVINE
jgi:hypothetical protein